MRPYYKTALGRLYHGDAVTVLPDIAPPASVDVVITDPPYSSGGYTRGDRQSKPSGKYQQSKLRNYVEFSGDNRDSIPWGFWCIMWMSHCFEAIKPGGYMLMFTDWRHLPMAANVLQVSGFVWRGLIAWDKTESMRAPHKGYFCHQCEYLVWESKGPINKEYFHGPWPGAYRRRVLQRDKHHMTGKPTPLMRDLVKCCPANGIVLDPFAGSGTTVIACEQTSRRWIAADIGHVFCDKVVERLKVEVDGKNNKVH